MIFLCDNPDVVCDSNHFDIDDKSMATLAALREAEFMFACHGYATTRTNVGTRFLESNLPLPPNVTQSVLRATYALLKGYEHSC